MAPLDSGCDGSFLHMKRAMAPYGVDSATDRPLFTPGMSSAWSALGGVLHAPRAAAFASCGIGSLAYASERIADLLLANPPPPPLPQRAPARRSARLAARAAGVLAAAPSAPGRPGGPSASAGGAGGDGAVSDGSRRPAGADPDAGSL